MCHEQFPVRMAECCWAQMLSRMRDGRVDAVCVCGFSEYTHTNSF